MKSCEMHLVLVLSDHVNVGKDPLYRPPKTQKAEEGRSTQTTVYPHVKASGKFPGKNPRAQKAHLYAFKETFLEKSYLHHSTDKRGINVIYRKSFRNIHKDAPFAP